MDFHQYCHEIFHWNLPSNPVDLEQREGRINRFKGHVIRRNVAKAFPLEVIARELLAGKVTPLGDPWGVIFELARAGRDPRHNDLIPYWVYEAPDGHKVVRHIPTLPLSRENDQMNGLRRTLAAYRMVFGQPRQEDMVSYLRAQDVDLGELLKCRINLEPVEREGAGG